MPNPLLAKLAEPCGADGECQSNLCDLEAKRCSQDCAQESCPNGLTCAPKSDGKKLCALARKEDDGCSVGASRTTQPGISPADVLLFALAVFFASGRRKK
jgi:hypothetical protein